MPAAAPNKDGVVDAAVEVAPKSGPAGAAGASVPKRPVGAVGVAGGVANEKPGAELAGVPNIPGR